MKEKSNILTNCQNDILTNCHCQNDILTNCHCQNDIIKIIKKLNTFIIKYIDDQEHNLVVDVEIHITGDQDDYCGMKYTPIDFFYIENGEKHKENYYNDNKLGAIIIKDDGVFWTNDIEEAFYNDRLLGKIITI